jgi:hemoglobin
MNTKAFHRRLLASCLVLGFSVSQVGPAIGAVQSAEKQATAKPSLYERLGGAYAIATVVDDFIEALLVNDVLNANPAIAEARAHVPKAGLKFHVTALVCQVTGGPQK